MSVAESQFRTGPGPAVPCATRDDALTSLRGSRRRVRLASSIRELCSAVTFILPGGTLISLALWMLQHRAWFVARARRGLSAAWTAAVRVIFSLR